MKYLSILLSLFIITTVSCQNKDEDGKIPEVVVLAFQKKYPKEDIPNWEVDAHGNYEAQFKNDGEKYRADFKPNGTWVETENSIKKKNLPKIIKEIIKKDFAQYEITEVEYVTHATLGVFYDVEFKQKGKNKDIMFKEDGTIISQ